MAEPGHAAPDIEGFELEETLGSGGFSDVYRYRQKFPRRSVAIKVLRTASLDRASRHQFIAEANAMAQLSNHPAIATIYSAGLSDDGQPYLIMEFCSRGSLGSSYRQKPMDVAEVLRIGVRIAGALESAHRLGITHRDVKPANILITDVGSAVLTDFGISVGGAELSEATAIRSETTTVGGLTGDSTTHGLSVPWAPPEAFDDAPALDARSDVYALAATLFTLLAGRTPFEIAGASNSALTLSRRIERGSIEASDRVDAYPSVARTLANAMAVDPADRPASALAFAEQLRLLEVELKHPPTPIELLGDSSNSSVSPEPIEVTSAPLPAASGMDPDATALRVPLEQDPGEDAERTRLRPPTPMVRETPVARPRSRRRRTLLIAGAALVGVLGVGVAVAAATGGFSGSPEAGPSASARPSEEATATPTPLPTLSAGEVSPCPAAFFHYVRSLKAGLVMNLAVPLTEDLYEPLVANAGLRPICGFQVDLPLDPVGVSWQYLEFEDDGDAAEVMRAALDEAYYCAEVTGGDDFTGPFTYTQCTHGDVGVRISPPPVGREYLGVGDQRVLEVLVSDDSWEPEGS